MPLNLLRGHIGNRAGHLLRHLGQRALRDHRDAEIAEQDLLASSKQQVFRFNVAVDNFLVMRILQSGRDLPDILDHLSKRQPLAAWVALAHRSIGSVVHDQKWRVALQAEVQDANDIGMNQTDESARLRTKALDIFAREICVQEFNRGEIIEKHLLAEVDIREAPASEKLYQAIIAHLLAHAIVHQIPPRQKVLLGTG